MFSIAVISERTLSMEEVTSDTLKDDFAWTTLLGDDQHDDNWNNVCRTQELVTDLTHSGDPSTYLTTPTTNISTHQLSSEFIDQHNDYHNHYNNHQHLQQLPSIDSIHQQRQHQQDDSQVMFHTLELSPASSKLDDDLFASPEYSEASNDGADNLSSSLELHQNLQHQVQLVPATSSQQTWTTTSDSYHSGEELITPAEIMDHQTQHVDESHNQIEVNMKQQQMMQGVNHHHQHSPTVDILSNQHNHQHQHEPVSEQQLISLPSMSTFRVDDSLSTLTPLEPVSTTTSVIVQDAHAHCWGDDYPWDETKTLSMLDANLDFDHLIDLDAL